VSGVEGTGSGSRTTEEGWAAGGIEGVWRRSLKVHADVRGAFLELWRADWTDALPSGADGEPSGASLMRQANLSRSAPRVLRGLHCHRRQADLWVVAEGHPFVALVDVRPAVEGSGRPVVTAFDAAPGDALYLPARVAHGFYARDAVTLVYLVTNEYDGSDELGFAWDDPALGIDWPDRHPTLSPRDSSAPPLSELVAALRGDRSG
jgi:dTDP-4-dehydrorhamnose 3,5-epimerase